MRRKKEDVYKKYLEIHSLLGNSGSLAKKHLEDHRWYMGHLVTANGLIIGPNGVVTPKLSMVRRRDKNGKMVTTGAIDKHEVRLWWKGKRTYRSYGRFIYAAFNEDFDIDDQSLIVSSTTDFRFEKSPYGYKAYTKDEWHKLNGERKMIFKEDERAMIYDTYMQAKDVMSVSEFASRIGVSPTYMNDLIAKGKSND